MLTSHKLERNTDFPQEGCCSTNEAACEFVLLAFNYAGMKHKAEEEGLAETLAKVFVKAEEVAGERREDEKYKH